MISNFTKIKIKTDEMNKNIQIIVSILRKYAFYMTDGFGYYCLPEYQDDDMLLNSIAQEINNTNKKVSEIVNVLYLFEKNMTDGFGHYCRPEYDNSDELVKHIAEEIIKKL